jgi:hypothetical protein
MRTSYLACGPVDPGRSVSGNCEPVVAPYPTTITVHCYSTDYIFIVLDYALRGVWAPGSHHQLLLFGDDLVQSHKCPRTVLPVALHGMFHWHAPSPVVLRCRSLRPAAMRSSSTNSSGNYAGLYSSRVSNYAVVFSQQHR